MTTRKVRGYGSFDDIPGKDALSFPLQPHLDGETMGFRLAHDSAYRVFRGGSWYDDPRCARVAFRDFVVPGLRSSLLGIRLVVDWRAE
jgi:hypothetical protein